MGPLARHSHSTDADKESHGAESPKLAHSLRARHVGKGRLDLWYVVFVSGIFSLAGHEFLLFGVEHDSRFRLGRFSACLHDEREKLGHLYKQVAEGFRVEKL